MENQQASWIGPYEGEALLDWQVLASLGEDQRIPSGNPFREAGMTAAQKEELAKFLQPMLQGIKQQMLEGGELNPLQRGKWLQQKKIDLYWDFLVKVSIGKYDRNKIGKQVVDLELGTPVKKQHIPLGQCLISFILIIVGVLVYIGLIMAIATGISPAAAVEIAIHPPWVVPVKSKEEINFQCIGNHSECLLSEEWGRWDTPFNWTFKTPSNETINMSEYEAQIRGQQYMNLLKECRKGPFDRSWSIAWWTCFYDRALRQLVGYEKIRLCPLGGYMFYNNNTGKLQLCTDELHIGILNMTISPIPYWNRQNETDPDSPLGGYLFVGNRHFYLNNNATNIMEERINFTITCNVIVPTSHVSYKKEFIGYNNNFLGPWGGSRYRSILIRHQSFANMTNPPLDLDCSGIPGTPFNGTEANYSCANGTQPYGEICTQPTLYFPCYNPNYTIPILVQCALHQEYKPNDTYRNQSDDMQVIRCRIAREIDIPEYDQITRLNLTLVKDPFLAYLQGENNFTCKLQGQYWAFKMKNASWNWNTTNATWLVPWRNFTKENYVWGAYSSAVWNWFHLKHYYLVKQPEYTLMPQVPSRKKRGLGLTVALIGTSVAGLIGATTGTTALVVSQNLRGIMLQQTEIDEQTFRMLKILQRRVEQSERMILMLHQRVSKIENFLQLIQSLRGMCPFKDICEVPITWNFTNYNESATIGEWAEQSEQDKVLFENILNNVTKMNDNMKYDLQNMDLQNWLSWLNYGSLVKTVIGIIICIIGIILTPAIIQIIKHMVYIFQGYHPVMANLIEIKEEINREEEEEGDGDKL
uniref:Envelope glycoprotein n=2 Tax=Feline immunodeficiency virus TaxID=11673 RepID=Q284M4_9RETR|nr:envelope glycoprotein [Feline immunodeficiency virus]